MSFFILSRNERNPLDASIYTFHGLELLRRHFRFRVYDSLSAQYVVYTAPFCPHNKGSVWIHGIMYQMNSIEFHDDYTISHTYLDEDDSSEVVQVFFQSSFQLVLLRYQWMNNKKMLIWEPKAKYHIFPMQNMIFWHEKWILIEIWVF